MTENETVLVDSNILVYAYDTTESQKHAIAKNTMKKIWETENGAMSIQNLAEFYATTTGKTKKKLSSETAKQIIIDYTQILEIISYNQNTIIKAIDIETIHKTHFWDALIIATMQENSIDTIITENEKDFKKIPWIKTINPFKQEKNPQKPA